MILLLLLSYLLISIVVFSIDRWLASGHCPVCKGICAESSILASISVALLWPAIIVMAVFAAVRSK